MFVAAEKEDDNEEEEKEGREDDGIDKLTKKTDTKSRQAQKQKHR